MVATREIESHQPVLLSLCPPQASLKSAAKVAASAGKHHTLDAAADPRVKATLGIINAQARAHPATISPPPRYNPASTSPPPRTHPAPTPPASRRDPRTLPELGPRHHSGRARS